MNGFVDADRRAMLEVHVRRSESAASVPVLAWIDTAFDGHLVFPRDLIRQLDLDLIAEAEAVLADGSIAVLKTFIGWIDWFGTNEPVHVIENAGQHPLLGTALLDGRQLLVDYRDSLVRLS